ncbi:Coenzyme F420 hydrogenase/dehydrogenase, beta subunit C-terminal domain [Ruegeria sp. SCP11]|uniref:Coenzyme F420 hydrogenase/dehydrogenase, beta subunit C-terminal domain n=1 Tax=Ruegeria sp. SCP11 TaxID=3141378 RepID=UPI003335C2C3
MPKTDPRTRFEKILKDDLCVGCGLCQSLLGTEKIRIDKAVDGDLRPVVCSELDEADVDLVYDTCPGTRCEGIPKADISSAPYHNLVWGPYHSLTLAWASEPEVRFEGSTGGVLTALARFLLNSGRVAFILHVKASEDEPSFGAATISTTVDEVLAAAGSRYGPTAPLINLTAALDRDQPFAVVAKPCDLNAIRNLAHRDARVNRLIKYMLTPVCGGFMPDQAMGRFLSDNGIDRDQVSALRYRGRGCPGPTTIEMADGTRRDFHYLDFWGEDESCWSLPFRCKICPDGIGEGADIAAADTWPVATPDRETSATDPGTNSIIARTNRGVELLEAAIAAGYLDDGGPVDIEFMNNTQPHQITKKRNMRARFNGLRRAGRLVPETFGLRLDALYLENSAQQNREQEEGTFVRATR